MHFFARFTSNVRKVECFYIYQTKNITFIVIIMQAKRVILGYISISNPTSAIFSAVKNESAGAVEYWHGSSSHA